MGARDKTVRKTSFVRISGEVRSDCTDCGVGEGVEATVCRMSPIWHVTAVHGSVPTKDPRKQSRTATPQTPHATFNPAHGTMPTRRSIDKRTHADDFGDCPEFDKSLLEEPSSAVLVMANTRGKTFTRNGAKGAERRLAQTEPIEVRDVRRMVAKKGEKRAPANTFQITLPGIDHACFHTAETEITAMT